MFLGSIYIEVNEWAKSALLRTRVYAMRLIVGNGQFPEQTNRTIHIYIYHTWLEYEYFFLVGLFDSFTFVPSQIQPWLSIFFFLLLSM